jgi:GNAT superfamily N-acetyltransferase
MGPHRWPAPRPPADDLPADDQPTGVIPASTADADILSQVIAEAFFDLPPSRWLIPDPGERREIFPAYFRRYVDDTLARGVAHTNPSRTAVALWRYFTEPPGDDPAEYRERLAAVVGPRTDQFLAFDQALGEHLPAQGPYHHLAILAVRPDRQGQGHGTALLAAYHQIIDRVAPAPAYLEAGSLPARDLYLDHGYTDHASMIQLPGGPLMYPMVRRWLASEP